MKQYKALFLNGKPVALIVPIGDLGEQEIITPKLQLEKHSQPKIPKVQMPALP